MIQPRFVANLAVIVILATVYFAAAKFGLILAFVHPSATAVWPPTGIALAALLGLGYRAWPGVFLGAFSANITTEGSLLTSIGIAAGNTLEALVGAYLVNRFANGRNVFNRAQDVFKFTLLAAMVSTALSATFGVTSLSLGGYADWNNYGSIWWTWWLGDLGGALILAPVLILWSREPPVQWNQDRVVEAALLLLFLILVAHAAFGELLPTTVKNYPLEFLCIPFPVWAAFRFGQRETVTATLLISVIAIWGTLRGLGPFARETQNESLLLLQMFMGVIAVMTMALAAGVSESKRADEALRRANDELDLRVQQRTAELSETTQALRVEIIERKDAEELIQQHLKRITALRDINLATTSTLELSTVLNILLDKIDLFLPYSTVTVRLFNKESGLLEPVACRNLDEKEWKALTLSGLGLLGTPTLGNKAPLMVRNVQTDPRTRHPEFYRKHGLVSYLGVPLIVKDEILGTISFYTKEEREFSNEEIEFLSTLGGQAAIAIHNSQLYQETVRANKVKDEFLSVMSHELRTPLNVVMGYTGMIKDGLLGDINLEQAAALGKILQQARDQLDLINSILHATSFEANVAKVESHELNLGNFINELTSAYDVPLEKGLTLNWDYPSNLPAVKTDSVKLKQILQNLINNGIKFTDKGQVTISVRLAKGNGQVEFKVADTGIGIPKEHLSLIFEKFRQVDSSQTRLHGGVGMGLYIVKKFTEMLGGTVEVESELGKGSTFTVTLPMQLGPRCWT